MNKFIHEPDSLLSLVGFFFWLFVLAGGFTLLFGAIYGAVR